MIALVVSGLVNQAKMLEKANGHTQNILNTLYEMASQSSNLRIECRQKAVLCRQERVLCRDESSQLRAWVAKRYEELMVEMVIREDFRKIYAEYWVLRCWSTWELSSSLP